MHNARQHLAAKSREEHLRQPNALLCPHIFCATLGTDIRMGRKLPRRGEPLGQICCCGPPHHVSNSKDSRILLRCSI